MIKELEGSQIDAGNYMIALLEDGPRKQKLVTEETRLETDAKFMQVKSALDFLLEEGEVKKTKDEVLIRRPQMSSDEATSSAEIPSIEIERESTPEEEKLRRIELDRNFNDDVLFGKKVGKGEAKERKGGLVDKYPMLPRYFIVKTFYNLKEEAENAKVVSLYGSLMKNVLDSKKFELKIEKNKKKGKEKKVRKQEKKYRKAKIAARKIRRKIRNL